MSLQAVLLYGPSYHHLDHLAPLSILLEIPLIITDDEVYEVATHYYPQAEIVFVGYNNVAQEVTENFDVIFTCFPRPIIDDIFFMSENLLGKRVETVWCPHGNSDKGKASYYMEALSQDKYALVYGKQMIEFLKEKNVFSQLKGFVEIDNFRRLFYKNTPFFYNELARKEIFSSLDPNLPIILYAPTWQDQEKNSSFLSATPSIIDLLPENYNLIIKLHPNLLAQMPIVIDQAIEDAKNHKNVVVLKQFPPIYPLLEKCDIYIGDMSSIGYDFLSFDRPMYFLNEHTRDWKKDPSLFLYRCGVSISKENYPNIYEIIKETLPHHSFDFSKNKKEIYEFAFGHDKSEIQLRQEIRLMCSRM